MFDKDTKILKNNAVSKKRSAPAIRRASLLIVIPDWIGDLIHY